MGGGTDAGSAAARETFREILRRVRDGETAERILEASGEHWYRRFQPRERLILLGCGHISRALCPIAASLGFAVTAVDDRPSFADPSRFPDAEAVLCDAFPAAVGRLEIGARDYVAVLTRGHRWDAECLRAVLSGAVPSYLGMVGSRRRAAALRRQLTGEGLDPALLDRIHAPIGLDIHALTVPEIAVSIAAELVAHRRRDLDRRSRSRILTDGGIPLDVLTFLAEDPAPRAVLTVIGTEGSTPVKSGAMMGTDALGRTVGTIGGGCGEADLLRAARRICGMGTRRLMEVELDADPEAEEGMVCGGSMEVLIEDVTG